MKPKCPCHYISLTVRPTSFRSFISVGLYIFLFFGVKASATEAVFKYIKDNRDSITTNIIISDTLPNELITYLNKGVPISIEYRIELWKERTRWFDKLVDTVNVNYNIRYDPWEKIYTVLQSTGNLSIECEMRELREALDLTNSTSDRKLALDGREALYYLIGQLSIKTMSFSNYKEVESWLRGGISNAKKPNLEEAPDKFGEFIFNTALKISGLKNLSRQIKSPKFTPSQIQTLYLNKN